MDLSTRIELFTAALLLITGVSHIVCPKAWSDLFTDLFRRPHSGLWIGLLTLPVGLLLVVTHNVWVADLTVIVTLLGWGWTIKGTLYLIVPDLPARKLKGFVERPRHFVIAGVCLCALGGVVLASVLPIGS